MERTNKNQHLADLMRAAQDGERPAYAVLLREVLPLLQRLVHSRLRFLQAADREDLVQDILLSVHAARATYDPGRPFVPWLVTGAAACLFVLLGYSELRNGKMFGRNGNGGHRRRRRGHDQCRLIRAPVSA